MSLLVAGVLALVVLSSMVAFNGLPGIAPTREVAEVRLPNVPPPADESGATARPSRVRVAAVPSRSERPRSAAVSSRSGRQQTAGEHTVRTRDTGGGGGTGRTERQAPAPVPQPDPAVEAPAVPLVPTEPEPQLVEDVTRQVQEVLDPVTRATERATGAVGDLAEGLLTP